MYGNMYRVKDQGILTFLSESPPLVRMGIDGRRCTMRLRVEETSAIHGGRPFRLQVAPAMVVPDDDARASDASLRAFRARIAGSAANACRGRSPGKNA